MDSYIIHLLILIGIYGILSTSLQLALGYGGLLNIGHIAFYGIGAYTSAILMIHGLPFWLAFLSAGALAGLFGFILSIPTNKLKGDYLAVSTLGFCFVVYAVLMNWTSLTHGSVGMPGIPKPEIFGFNITSNNEFLVLVFIVLVISYFFINRIVSSPFGKVLEALRDDTLAARTLGKNTFKIKSVTMITSAFFAGIAGSLYAHYISYIDPSSFGFSQVLPILLIVMVGGVASLPGSLFASIILVLLPEPIRFMGIPSGYVGCGRQIIYSVLLLVILRYQPKGFFGRIELG